MGGAIGKIGKGKEVRETPPRLQEGLVEGRLSPEAPSRGIKGKIKEEPLGILKCHRHVNVDGGDGKIRAGQTACLDSERGDGQFRVRSRQGETLWRPGTDKRFFLANTESDSGFPQRVEQSLFCRPADFPVR